MANFLKLHDYTSGELIYINMDVIETVQEGLDWTELVGVKHWTTYSVREKLSDIFEEKGENENVSV